MNAKNYTTEAEEREHRLCDDIRYTYLGSRVEINGTGYPVVAAIPFMRANDRIPTAADTIQKMLEGK